MKILTKKKIMICEIVKKVYDVELNCAFWSESDLPFIKCWCPKEFSLARKNENTYTGVCPGYIPSGQVDLYMDELNKAYEKEESV